MARQGHLGPVVMTDLTAGQYFLMAVQLSLFYWVVRVFSVEEVAGFLKILPVILAGFAIHALLGPYYRKVFFLGLSLVTIWMTLGNWRGALLLGLGVALIGICHLPLRLFLRVLLLLLIAGGLGFVAIGWVKTPGGVVEAVLPVLGAIFMFRLIVYLYDLEHEKGSVSVWQRLSYFFLLPNPIFLLFPVIDFRTYVRTYYSEPSFKIYQKGIQWCFRGVIHLLLYRLVYYHFTPAGGEIQNIWGVLHFMLSSYLLYLRVSGQFHLIIGLLCLFGHNLPETHHRYYLASGFNDFWRRINIYWKDFMMKIFYYPVFKKLNRRLGLNWALVLATAFVFVSTWLLHSYQSFWIRGSFPLTAVDGIFWGVLGVLVVINSLNEAKRSRSRSLLTQPRNLRQATLLSVKTVAMFSFMCVLWSFWSSGSVSRWLTIVSAARVYTAADIAGVLVILIAAIGIGVLAQFVRTPQWTILTSVSFRRVAGSAAAVTAVVFALGATNLSGLGKMQVVESLRHERFSRQDQALFERGYYEEIISSNNFANQLWKVQSAPSDWKALAELPNLARRTDDILEVELLPSVEGIFKRALLRTNSWGMRDRFYELKKPDPAWYRIALVGASEVMGSGIEDQDTFETILEDRLNQAALAHRFEILNFAVGSYTVLQNAVVVQRRVFTFEPDAVFYIAHPRDDSQVVDNLKKAVLRNARLEHEFLLEVVEKSGVRKGMNEPEVRRRIEPYALDLIRWGYQTMVEESRKHGLTPVWIFVPLSHGVDELEEYEKLSRLAKESGFRTLSLAGLFDGLDAESYRLAPWDGHLNAKGHRLVADRLYETLLENKDVLGLESSR